MGSTVSAHAQGVCSRRQLFTRAAARRLYPSQRLQRWCFDVELLLLAQTLGVPVAETSVTWTEIPGALVALQRLLPLGFFPFPSVVQAMCSWSEHSCVLVGLTRKFRVRDIAFCRAGQWSVLLWAVTPYSLIALQCRVTFAPHWAIFQSCLVFWMPFSAGLHCSRHGIFLTHVRQHERAIVRALLGHRCGQAMPLSPCMPSCVSGERSMP